jgi:hypothetical protein
VLDTAHQLLPIGVYNKLHLKARAVPKHPTIRPLPRNPTNPTDPTDPANPYKCYCALKMASDRTLQSAVAWGMGLFPAGLAPKVPASLLSSLPFNPPLCLSPLLFALCSLPGALHFMVSAFCSLFVNDLAPKVPVLYSLRSALCRALFSVSILCSLC